MSYNKSVSDGGNSSDIRNLKVTDVAIALETAVADNRIDEIANVSLYS
jgi:hypothetical protein